MNQSKIIQMAKNYKISIYFLVLLSLLLTTHYQLVKEDHLSDYDDNIVVKPMEKINSIASYIVSIDNGLIIDRQPIRDLSYSVDYYIKARTGVSVFHLQNILVWFITLIITFLLLIELNFPTNAAMLLTSFYAFHPAVANSISWISARKHLLSALFILLATLVAIRAINKFKQEISGGSIFLIFLFYILSCLSQPINIMWPLWLITFYFFKIEKTKLVTKKFIWFFLIIFSIAICIYLLNTNYYSIIYESQYGVKKYISESESQISIKLLSIGASFFQVMVPIWPTPSSYYPGSMRNLYGLFLLVIFLFYIYKKKQITSWIWLLFTSLPLIVTTIRMTNIFGSDTYLIIPVLGVYIVIGLIIPKTKVVGLSLLPVLIFFIFNSNEVSRAWSTSKSLWTYALKNEETPSVLKNLSLVYYKEGQYQTSFEFASKLWDWNPSLNHAEFTYAQALYAVRSINDENKIKLFQKALEIKPQSSWLNFYFSRLYCDLKEWEFSYRYLKKIKLSDLDIFGSDIGIRVAELENICLNANTTETKACGELVIEAKNLYPNNWNQSKYERKKRSLSGLRE